MLQVTSKFSLGTILASAERKYIGVVTRIEATMAIDGVSIRYIIRGNEKEYWVNEKDAVALVESKAA